MSQDNYDTKNKREETMNPLKLQLEVLSALKDIQLQHARLLYMIAHMYKLGKISEE